jgi:hypothetical protein
LAQNPLGSYVNDDDDLPVASAPQPAAQPQPRNDLGQFQSPPAPAAQPAAAPYGQQPVAAQQPQQPAAPQHNTYMANRARSLGIDPNQFAPDTLGAVLAAVEQNQQAARAAAAPPPAPPTPEPGPDWGEDDQGNPITTEEQAKKIYPRALFNAIKNSHQVEKLAKQNEELQRTLTQERQERIAARVEGKLNRLLAARPELFGQDPSAVQPGTVEWHRRAAVINHLNGLAASKQQTTLEADVAGALAIFGPATAPPPAAKGKGQQSPAGPSPTDLAAHYRAAELARTTGRAGATSVTRRDLLIEAKRQELEANGSPVVASGGGDDDDDLLPPHKG